MIDGPTPMQADANRRSHRSLQEVPSWAPWKVIFQRKTDFQGYRFCLKPKRAG